MYEYMLRHDLFNMVPKGSKMIQESTTISDRNKKIQKYLIVSLNGFKFSSLYDLVVNKEGY